MKTLIDIINERHAFLKDCIGQYLPLLNGA